MTATKRTTKRTRGRGEAIAVVKPKPNLAHPSSELQALERQFVQFNKSKNMLSNRLRALVAGSFGYHSGLTEPERRKMHKRAQTLIDWIVKHDEQDHDQSTLVLVHYATIERLTSMENELRKGMETIVKGLPIAAWVQAPEQRGISLTLVGRLIGETGDLNNYANPGKVWRRMGCAPWTYKGETHMGKAWQCKGTATLPADEWTAYGYSPRRRALMHVIGEGFVKQNMNGNGKGDLPVETDGAPGPYRSRFLQSRDAYLENHPGCRPIWARDHGIMLAAKLFLKNLWIEWTGG